MSFKGELVSKIKHFIPVELKLQILMFETFFLCTGLFSVSKIVLLRV